MAIQTLHPQFHMNVMPELNRLLGGLLGLVDPVSRDTEQCKAPDQNGDQPSWLTEPIKKITDHAYSCIKISTFRFACLVYAKNPAAERSCFAAKQELKLTEPTTILGYKHKPVPITLQ